MEDGSNRLKGGFGRSSNLYVKRRARALVFEQRKIRLFGLLAKTSITEVGHNTDHFDVGLDVRPGARRDARAERVAPRQISFDKGFVHDGRPITRLIQRPGIVLVEASPGDQPDTQSGKELGAYGIHQDTA